MKHFIMITSLATLFVGCSVSSKTKTTDIDYIRKSGIIAHPLLAEVEVKNE